MTLIEAVEKLGESLPNEKSVELTPGVQKTLKISKIDEYLGEREDFELERQIHENGDKLLIVSHWPSKNPDILNQMILSIRENEIKFIGNNAGDKQFIKISGDDLSNPTIVVEAMAKTILNPSLFSSKQV